jgi:hypothetical protein
MELGSHAHSLGAGDRIFRINTLEATFDDCRGNCKQMFRYILKFHLQFQLASEPATRSESATYRRS